MLQNKIYQNFILEIFKTFFVILFGLSAIALTVRAVAFLELIVGGYLLTKSNFILISAPCASAMPLQTCPSLFSI